MSDDEKRSAETCPAWLDWKMLTTWRRYDYISPVSDAAPDNNGTLHLRGAHRKISKNACLRTLRAQFTKEAEDEALSHVFILVFEY